MTSGTNQVIHETERFRAEIMIIPGEYSLPQYAAINKQHNVVEFANPCFFYVKTWMKEMEQTLDEDEGIVLAPSTDDEDATGYN